MKEKIKNWLRKYRYCFIWKREWIPIYYRLYKKTVFNLNDWWPDMNWGNWSKDNQAVYLPENIEQIPGGGVKLIARRQNCKGYRWKRLPNGTDIRVYREGFKFSSGCMKSKELYDYGRYLWNVKMPDYIGAFCAVWLYEGNTDEQGIDFYEEIDFELFAKSSCSKTQIVPGVYKGKSHAAAIHTNNHIKCIKPSKRFYWYEIDWQEDYIKFYIGGRLVYHVTENIPTHSLAVVINHGIGQYPKMKDWSDFKIGEVVGEMIIKQFIYIKQ